MKNQMSNEDKAQILRTYWPLRVMHHGTPFLLIGIESLKAYCLHPANDAYTDELSVENLQLLLRPLSSITDEDAREVAKIADKNVEYRKGNNHHTVIDKYKFIRTENSGKIYIGIERYVGDRYYGYEALPTIASLYNIEQIDYLRSRGYNCGYGKYSAEQLVDMGVVVYEKKEVGND